MKHLVLVFTLCCLFSVAAFGMLVAADRQLGLPLPFSIPLSFTAASIVAPALFALANAVRLRRPVILKAAAAPSPITQPHTAAARRAAEGVVILDFSTAKKFREQAA